MSAISLGFLSLLYGLPAFAGGGPMNVLVLYNGADPEAAPVAERYAELRALPPGHLCAIEGIDPSADAIGYPDYASTLQPAVAACLDALPQGAEVDYLVIVRGLPYRVDIEGGYSTSLDAMLQVWDAEDSHGLRLAGQPQDSSQGLYAASVDNPVYIPGRAHLTDFTLDNPYMSWYMSASSLSRLAEWPESFRRGRAGTAGGVHFDDQLFVVTRLDGFDYADAMALAERGAAADGAFPAGRWLCMESADSARGARDPECELATRLLGDAGFDAEWRSPHDAALSGESLVAYFTGAADLQGAIAGNTFAPGAIADNLTSYGAVPQNFHCDAEGSLCPESESQTSIARFVRAGVTGVQGTVAEPLNNCFPNAGALLMYAAGYNLGESFLFNQRSLYWQNIVLGDPLATPWDERPVVEIPEVVAEGGSMTITATHPRGISAIFLYIDGVLVAEGAGDSLEFVPDAVEGESLSLLVVAVAADAAMEVADWPEPSVLPQVATQGWEGRTVIVGAAEWVDSGVEGKPGACGCGGTRGGGGSWVLALGLLLWRRLGS